MLSWSVDLVHSAPSAMSASKIHVTFLCMYLAEVCEAQLNLLIYLGSPFSLAVALGQLPSRYILYSYNAGHSLWQHQLRLSASCVPVGRTTTMTNWFERSFRSRVIET
jgi:hypothetical protein